MIEQARFTYSPLGKAFEKQVKTIEDQGKSKQVVALNTLKSNSKLTIEDVTLNNDEAKKELDKIQKIEKTVDREKLINKTKEYTYSFKNFRTIKAFGRDIYAGKITLKEADEDQADLLSEIIIFLKNSKTKNYREKTRQKIIYKNLYILKVEKEFLMLLIVKYFQ